MVSWFLILKYYLLDKLTGFWINDTLRDFKQYLSNKNLASQPDRLLTNLIDDGINNSILIACLSTKLIDQEQSIETLIFV